MPTPQESVQLAVDAMARFDAGDKTQFNAALDHVRAAVDAVGVPKGPPGKIVCVRPRELTDAQREVLGLVARRGFGVFWYQVPRYPFTLLRWLGIEPEGLLETLEVEVNGASEPLYRALQLHPDRITEIVNRLPLATILQVLGELYTYGGGYSVENGSALSPTSLRLFADLADEGRAWALALANTLAADPRRQGGGPLDELVLLALVRAKVPLEERWQSLFPNHMWATREVVFECARALPSSWRAVPLARVVRTTSWPMELLEVAPDVAVAQAWLDVQPLGSPYRLQRVKMLKERFGAHPEIATLVAREAALNKPPPVFVVLGIRSIDDAAQLSPLDREQLRIAGRGYDQQDLEAEARLADDNSEQSFLGHLELRSIADTEGEPWLDAVLFAVDSGVLFRAGTIEELGWVSQGGVSLRDDDVPTRHGLQIAISNRPVMAKKPKGKPKPKPSPKPKPKR